MIFRLEILVSDYEGERSLAACWYRVMVVLCTSVRVPRAPSASKLPEIPAKNKINSKISKKINL